MFHWRVMSIAGEDLIFYGFVFFALWKKVLGRIFKQLHFVCKSEVEVHNGRRWRNG